MLKTASPIRLKIIRISLVCLILSIVLITLYSVTSSLRESWEKEKNKGSILSIDLYNLELSNSETVKLNELFENSFQIVLIYFSTDCIYCQHEAESINLELQSASFQKIKWLWVSSDSKEEIRKFAKDNKLFDRKNINVLYDHNSKLYKVLDNLSIPSTLLYNSDGEILHVFKGEAEGSKIIDKLNSLN